MNCSSPFYSTVKVKMGDKVLDPNFMMAIDFLATLTLSCLTDGINNARTYSPYSIY